MKILYVLAFTFFTLSTSFSQTKFAATKSYKILSLGIGLSCVSYGDVGGVNFDLKYFFSKRISTGITFLLSEGTTSKNFDATIGKPSFKYNEVGWITQYAMIDKPKFQLNVGITNGLSTPQITDDAQKVSVRTRYSTRTVSKTVAYNIYYLLQPRLEMAYKITKQQGFGLWLTTKANYNFLFGKSDFGEVGEFPKSSFSVGLMIK
jgi:hypothetical protein